MIKQITLEINQLLQILYKLGFHIMFEILNDMRLVVQRQKQRRYMSALYRPVENYSTAATPIVNFKKQC